MGAIGLCVTAIAGCGGGERQDANEPSGDFRMEVTEAEFPSKQKLAKRSTLEITRAQHRRPHRAQRGGHRSRLRRAARAAAAWPTPSGPCS